MNDDGFNRRELLKALAVLGLAFEPFGEHVFAQQVVGKESASKNCDSHAALRQRSPESRNDSFHQSGHRGLWWLSA